MGKRAGRVLGRGTHKADIYPNFKAEIESLSEVYEVEGSNIKQGKNPTRTQKDKLKALNLNPRNWLVERDLPVCLVIVHRITGEVRRLERSSV
jgi:hypothetical protein